MSTAAEDRGFMTISVTANITASTPLLHLLLIPFVDEDGGEGTPRTESTTL